MKLALATAVAITGMAFLPLPFAAAGPMVPLAPPTCDSFKFYGLGNIIEDYGPDLFTGWNADGMSGRVNTHDGYYSANIPEVRIPEGVSMNGAIKGGITGRHVVLTVTWDDGPLSGTTDQFWGQVYSETEIRGTLKHGVDGQGETWHWQGEVKCITPVASPDTPPTQATVVVETNIYDKPDGKGKEIGTLEPGEVHPLMEPCRDDWCRVGTIELGGFPGLPNGTAWVYSKGYLTFS
jgi:hypothetical protein